ncbi:hypothetical protein ACPUER_11865 [Burkholderia sp. DN3021]|uniref:hypothetical protein n=1 Tax=Burkholderia sp. DN3021 TaxID=3410137 RepID=UPI003C7B4A42
MTKPVIELLLDVWIRGAYPFALSTTPAYPVEFDTAMKGAVRFPVIVPPLRCSRLFGSTDAALAAAADAELAAAVADEEALDAEEDAEDADVDALLAELLAAEALLPAAVALEVAEEALAAAADALDAAWDAASVAFDEAFSAVRSWSCHPEEV